jgi:hypothetical protein
MITCAALPTSWASPGERPLLGKIFEIDRENPGFLRKRLAFQNPGDAPADFWLLQRVYYTDGI